LDSKPRFLHAILLLAIINLGGCQDRVSDTVTDFVALGGDRLYYEVSGSGFPLVLVSGGSGMDLRQWDRVVATLAAEYQVVRYDPRGVGKSDNPTTQYSDIEDLGHLLDHLGLERVGVIGLSSAGGFVLEFAIELPERVAGVVAAAPFVPGFEFSESMMERLNKFNQAAEEGREPFLDGIFEDAHFIPAPLDRSVRVAARAIMADNFTKAAGIDQDLAIPFEPPLIDRLSEVEAPVLLLAGELDHPEVLRRNQFLMDRIPTVSEQKISAAGHNAPLENPDGFIEGMAEFLKGLDVSSSRR
jgi:pimeloyl-ACP methyl ester carboxylesterase